MKKILVIDDNEDILENIAELLELNNYKVISAKNIIEGEKLAFECLPDMVLSDIRMDNEFDGFVLLKKLKENPLTREIPFIFLSVLGETNNVVNGLELGAQDYVVKPYESEILLARIKVHLELRQARLDLEKINYELTQQIEQYKANRLDINLDDIEKNIKSILNQYSDNPEIVNNYKNFTKDIPVSMIENNQFKQVFQFLKLKTSNDNKLAGAVSVAYGNYNELKESNFKNLIKYNTYQRELNKIRNNLLGLIDEIF